MNLICPDACLILYKVRENEVYSTISSSEDSGDVLLADQNGIILSAKDKSMISRPISDFFDYQDGRHVVTNRNQTYYITSAPVDRTNWRLLSIVDYNGVMKPVHDMRITLIVINLLFFLILVPIVLLVSSTISKPVLLLIREAELQALQSQIKPHFLFNTLNSIKWAAIAEGNNKTEEMIVCLIRLLRMSMSREEDIIPRGDRGYRTSGGQLQQ